MPASSETVFRLLKEDTGAVGHDCPPDAHPSEDSEVKPRVLSINALVAADEIGLRPAWSRTDERVALRLAESQ